MFEGVADEVPCIYTTVSITTWVIKCILPVCNFVEDTKLQGVLSTLKDKFKIKVGFVVGWFFFPVFIIINRLFCKIMNLRKSETKIQNT